MNKENTNQATQGVVLECTPTGSWRRAVGPNDLLVDVYDSAGMSGYALVVPKGTDLKKLSGIVGDTIVKLEPLVKMRTGIFDELYHGALAAFLKGQINELGAGLVRSKIQFEEIA